MLSYKMNLSSIRLISIAVLFLSVTQKSSSAARAPSPLKLRFRPDERDESKNTGDYLIPIDTPVDLNSNENYYFSRAFGGILRFDNPQNFWNAEITGWPSNAFQSVCYLNHDSDGGYSSYSDEELLQDHRLLKLFTDPPQSTRSRLGADTGGKSDGDEKKGVVAVFCAAYYIRLNRFFEIYKSRLMGEETIR